MTKEWVGVAKPKVEAAPATATMQDDFSREVKAMRKEMYRAARPYESPNDALRRKLHAAFRAYIRAEANTIADAVLGIEKVED